MGFRSGTGKGLARCGSSFPGLLISFRYDTRALVNALLMSRRKLLVTNSSLNFPVRPTFGSSLLHQFLFLDAL